MDLTQLLDVGFLSELLSDSGKASLTEKLLIVGAVWICMGRTVAKHFKSIETRMTEGFGQVTQSIAEVKHALTHVETSHATQIKALTERVEVLEVQIKPSEGASSKNSDLPN